MPIIFQDFGKQGFPDRKTGIRFTLPHETKVQTNFFQKQFLKFEQLAAQDIYYWKTTNKFNPMKALAYTWHKWVWSEWRYCWLQRDQELRDGRIFINWETQSNKFFLRAPSRYAALLTYLLDTWNSVQTSEFWYCKIINLGCLSPQVCGDLLQQE